MFSEKLCSFSATFGGEILKLKKTCFSFVIPPTAQCTEISFEVFKGCCFESKTLCLWFKATYCPVQTLQWLYVALNCHYPLNCCYRLNSKQLAALKRIPKVRHWIEKECCVMLLLNKRWWWVGSAFNGGWWARGIKSLFSEDLASFMSF